MPAIGPTCTGPIAADSLVSHYDFAAPFLGKETHANPLTAFPRVEGPGVGQLGGWAPAAIDATDGGAFSCFGGMIEGRNIECVPGERLVQAWRAKNWEPGVYSIAHFELAPDAEGTRLSFDHIWFPEGQGEHLAQGWMDNYWGPMHQALAENG